jgi:hypothetical protein
MNDHDLRVRWYDNGCFQGVAKNGAERQRRRESEDDREQSRRKPDELESSLHRMCSFLVVDGDASDICGARPAGQGENYLLAYLFRYVFFRLLAPWAQTQCWRILTSVKG